jgi:diguanylate cyclase (GGDEF)-like protein
MEQPIAEPVSPPPGGDVPGPAAGSHVLIVDDSPTVRAALRAVLDAMPAVAEVSEAVDGLDALSRLAQRPAHLVISDVTMPRLDGFKLLAAIRDNPRFRDTMVIMLSSHGESVDKVRGLTIGANDYVTKPFERGELQARVTVMLKMHELQEQLQLKNAALERANRELERLASIDALTGLANRRVFFERLEVELCRARRLGNPLAFLMLDIDHFKAFNDRHGHQGGDQALRAVAAALRRGTRTYDLAGRYGGEEFAAYLPQTAAADALAIAERLRGAVEALAVEVAPGVAAGATVSIGIACWPDVPAEGLEHLVAAADRALYLSKEGGRNCCTLAVSPAGAQAPAPARP